MIYTAIDTTPEIVAIDETHPFVAIDEAHPFVAIDQASPIDSADSTADFDVEFFWNELDTPTELLYVRSLYGLPMYGGVS